MRKNTRKIRLLINGMGGSNWIGGLYYKRNILFSLLSNEAISRKVAITVVTETENAHIFSSFADKIDIKCISYRNSREQTLKFMIMSLLSKATVIYPHFGKWQKMLPSKGISWIPDFQHNRLPEFFQQDELIGRNRQFQKIADGKDPLILSSNDSLRDFRELYSSNKKNVYVVPFVSYIEPELKQMDKETEARVLQKFDLTEKKYIAVMNQFWQHKNHLVIFNAMKKYFESDEKCNVLFVFTGALEDYRNPEYIQQLKEMMENPKIKNHTKLLGFIDRMEQLAVMKNAEYIIQPSLFEGWGTVVEDAKVLDKTILLSDIPVHREQKSEKCIFFDPYDEDMLAFLIAQENQKEHKDDIICGLEDMHERAIQYSAGFEALFCDVGLLKEQGEL